MTVTITKGATTLTPLALLEYRHARQYGNLVHEVINSSSVDVVYEVPGLRSGTLQLLCADLTAALALDALHTATGTYTLADSVDTALGMTYVPVGECTVELEQETLTKWIVTIGFQEVS